MFMMPLGALLLPALCFLGAVIPPGLQYATFSHNATKFLHLIMDPNSGTLYLGATNFLFQLTSGLALEEAVSTGPSLDSKDCLPPVTRQECPQAQETDNYNKLLLVNSPKEELIVCGSVWQGICEKRRLGFIDRVLFQPQTPGDTQYVAANDPNISTVGLIGYAKDNMPLLFVGRGYTSRGVGGSIPPITTRNLGTHPEQDPHSIFSYEETAKLAVGRLSEYNHHFVKSFTHGSSVYFLFYRRDLKSHSREYRTYISRICLDDAHYYSYVELPLLCRSKGKTYSHLQAAYVSQPGGEGGAGRGDVLFVAFSAWQASSGKLSEESALCIYTMDEVDRLATRTRDLCYTKDGKSEEGVEVAYIEYDVSSNCVQLSADTLDAYPCGSDHTPSPMASRVPLEAEPILEKPDARLTAVAVSIEDGHTVIFLGDSKGCLHKVGARWAWHGKEGWHANLYASLVIQPNSAVSGDLLFDLPKKHLYVMTQSMVRIPIFECSQYPDCESCLALRDPYCGWCVLQGRCSRRSECSRFKVSEQWLWGFESTQQCLSVQSLSPANISREEQKNVFLTLSDLPALRDGESYTCFFEEYESPAVPMGSGIMCLSPDPRLPFFFPFPDHVTIQLMVRFNDVFITSTPFSFYDCRAVALLRKSAPCQGCVSSHWGCNWCVHQHLCTHKDACEKGTVIYNERVCELSQGPEACPCVRGIQGSSLMPVNVQRKITLIGSNFHLYQVNLETELRHSGGWGGGPHFLIQRTVLAGTHPCLSLSFSAVTLYNCSVGHLDCSRCQTADAKYGCVWCSGEQPSCLFRDSCKEDVADTCPAPLIHVYPLTGLVEGGTRITITGSNLGQKHQDIAGRVTVAGIPCEVDALVYEISSSQECCSLPLEFLWLNVPSFLPLPFAQNPELKSIYPTRGPKAGGTCLTLTGSKLLTGNPSKIKTALGSRRLLQHPPPGYWLRVVIDLDYWDIFEEPCEVNSSSLILCKTPAIKQLSPSVQVKLEFVLDNLSFDFNTVHPRGFSYEVDPVLHPLNMDDHTKPYRHKPGSVISVEGENLDLAISKEEVKAMIGVGVCSVKTLTKNHLYCEPPAEQPAPLHRAKREGTDSLPEFTVQMGNNQFRLGRVQYDTESQLTFPVEAQIGLGVVASFVALIVLIIVFIYRRKSKQALRDYKKVQIQLENLETSVRDRCKKEFTDLMTEMMDLTSDLVGTGIPFLDYKSYAERVFFPGHRESPLQRDLDVPECRRQTVEQGLVQLSNLLNSKLFLTKFIHTLEIQRTFSPRDRAYVASLLTVSLHGKLEYFTDILKTLLNDLVEQYVAKNPKLMLRRTETVVEKLLTNWMSICLYAFDSVGEPLYMLFRGIKHQVDKGPVDWVTGKAKYTLNDNRLLREDLEYRTLTLTAVAQTGSTVGGPEGSQGVLVKGLDCDTITQVKEKILDQVYKGTPYCHRPDPDTLDLEWRSGLAGHLILSDEDVTSVVQGNWKRLNTLQHYKVPDGATVALVPLPNSKHMLVFTALCIIETPMLEDADEGGMKLWHLVKPTEEPELPKHRRGSVRERERAKAIPEIYLTRLLSMKGTMQKFVDDLFQVILSTSRPVPLAVKYFFDLLDDQALSHGITDPETIHIWKTNSLPLRFWINIIKNPQFVFDVQTSDNVDAVLLVIAQTFMDSCTLADHKLGRDSPINKLLYARDIPRYKQMVERYYADIRQTISASDQEMNSALAELSRNYSGDLNSLVALHELYKYINKYYDQIITALEEDPTAQKMQLGYRLQQIAAAVENKVTDL
uniref:Plexin-B1 n=1 Tax=Podarcis muralis TaxID=64176 RepID=A0A670K6W7_PODMU